MQGRSGIQGLLFWFFPENLKPVFSVKKEKFYEFLSALSSSSSVKMLHYGIGADSPCGYRETA
jgi:hypothetical protein